MKDKLIGCGGAILTASIVVIPALVAAYYIIAPLFCENGVCQ